MIDTVLPAPLVSSEVDLRDFQYMELDVRVLRDSRFAAQVTGDAFRAGVLLWCAAWHQVPCGSLPDDDIELANLAGYGRFVKEWRKVREEALQGFVKCNDFRWYHEVVCEKANAAWNSKLMHFFERAKDRLRKANKARAIEGKQALTELTFEAWNEARLSGAVPMEKAEASAGIPQNVPPATAGIPPENALRGNRTERNRTEKERNGELREGKSGAIGPPSVPAKVPAADAAPTPPNPRGERMPKDWQLPKAWGDWALSEYPQWTPDKVRTEAQKFRDHWCAKTGKDATKLDWLATWRNWCRSPIAHRDDPKPGKIAPVDPATRDEEARQLLGFASATAHRQEILDA